MRPIGLTIKATNKKYGLGRGELMLIHLCTECASLSINRIAADDVAENIFRVFEANLELDAGLRERLRFEGIRLLQMADNEAVRSQLFGANPTFENRGPCCERSFGPAMG